MGEGAMCPLSRGLLVVLLLLHLCGALRLLQIRTCKGGFGALPVHTSGRLHAMSVVSGDEKLVKLIASCENTNTNVAVSEALFTLGTHISRSHSSSSSREHLSVVNSTVLIPQLNSLVLKLIQRLDVHDKDAQRVILKPIQLCKSLLGIVRVVSYDGGKHFDAIYSPEARSLTLQLLESSSDAHVVSGMNGQGVSNLIWSLGSLGFQVSSLPPPLMEGVFARTLCISTEMTDQTISNILIGLHRMGYRWTEIPTPLQSCLSSAICRQCLKLSPQAVGNILYSLGKLGASYMVLTDRVHMALELGVRRAARSMVRRDVMQVVQGLALMQYSWPALSPATQEAVAMAVYSQASKQWVARGQTTRPLGQSTEIGTTLYSLAQMGVGWAAAPPALRAGVLMAFTALAAASRDEQLATSRALAASLYSLSKLGVSYPSLPAEVRRAVARCLLDLPFNAQELVMITKALGRMGVVWFTDLPAVVQGGVYRQILRALACYEKGDSIISSSDVLSYQGFSTILFNLGRVGVALQELPADLRLAVDERCQQCLQGADIERLSSLLHVLLSIGAKWDDLGDAARHAALQALLQALEEPTTSDPAPNPNPTPACVSSAVYSLAAMGADLTPAGDVVRAIARYVSNELPAMSTKNILNWMRATDLAVGPSERSEWSGMQSQLLQAVLQQGEELAADPLACAVALSTLSSIEHVKSGAARAVVVALANTLLVRTSPAMAPQQLTISMFALCSLKHTAASMDKTLLYSLLSSSRRALLSAVSGDDEVAALLSALAAQGVQWPQLQAGAAADRLGTMPTLLSAQASLELYSSLVKMRCFDTTTTTAAGRAGHVSETLFLEKLYRAEPDSEGAGSLPSRVLSGDSGRRMLRTLEALSNAGLHMSSMRPDSRQLFLLRSCQSLVESPPVESDSYYMQRLLRALSLLGVRWTQLPPTGQYIVLAYSAKCIDLANKEDAHSHRATPHVPFPLLAELVALGCGWADMRRVSSDAATKLLHSALEDFTTLSRDDVGRMVEDSARLTKTISGLGLEFEDMDGVCKRLLVGGLAHVCRNYAFRQRSCGDARIGQLSALQLLPMLGPTWSSLPTRPRNALSMAMGDVLSSGDVGAAECVLRALAATGGKTRMFTKNLRDALTAARRG